MRNLPPTPKGEKCGATLLVLSSTKFFIGIFLSFWFFVSQAQVKTQPDGTDIQDAIELNAQQTESESFDYDNSLDELEHFREHPIDLNKAQPEELNDLPLLTSQQISSLRTYISLHGKLISIFELQAVPGFDIAFIQKLLPYVTVEESVKEFRVTAKQLFTKGNILFVSRYRQVIEKSDGYSRADSKGYSGKPFGLFARVRYTYGTKLSYGITAEKDPGEEFFKGANKQGFDFYSGHFFMRDMKALKALALGDFEVRFGQGLIMRAGFGLRKSPMVMNVKRDGMKLRPYTSLNEFNFMRGAGFTVGKKGFEFTAFGSLKQVDGNILASGDTALNGDESFSSFNESGFHRTVNEIADRNSVNLVTAGGNFSYNTPRWHVGVNGLYNRFLKNYTRSLYPYNQYDLNKNWLVNASVDYHFLVKNFHFFGEEAISDNYGFGLLNGVMVSVDPRVDVAVVHRYFSRNYQAIWANAFAEASKPQNENGAYLSVSVKPISMLRIDGYFDLYMSKWLKYLTDAPSFGSDNFLQATFIPNKKFEMYARFHFELKKKNESANETPVDYLTNEIRQALRFNAKYKISDAVTLGNRVEWSFYRIGKSNAENGFVIYQDANFKMMKFPLSFNARIAIFKTSSYNTRIYSYENDVLYSFSIPAYYGNGLRWYLTLHYSATRNIDFWVRVAQTNLFDSKTYGSGLDEINANHKTEVKVQMRLRF